MAMREGNLTQDISNVNFGAIGRRWAIPPPGVWDVAPDGPHCVSCWQPHVNDVTYNIIPAGVVPSIDTVGSTLPSSFLYENKSEHGLCLDPSISRLEAPISDLVSEKSNFVYRLTTLNSTAFSTGIKQRNQGVSLIIQQKGLSYTMKQIAASLTKVGLDTSNETIFGNVTTGEVFVEVRWAWLSLPLGLEALGIIFVAAVIILSRKHHASLWKCSLLPLVFHALEGEALQAPEKLSNMDAMDDRARRVMARISNVAGGEKLVVASQ